MLKQKLLILFSFLILSLAYTYYSKNKTLEILTVNQSLELLKEFPNISSLEFISPSTYKFEKFNQNVLPSNQSYKIFFHFWATWCAPCEKEFPDLLNLVSKLNSQDWIIFIVAVNDDYKKVEKFFSRFPQLLELNSKAESNVYFLFDNNNVHKVGFNTYKLPETIIFDQNKKLLKRFVGPQDWMSNPDLKNFFKIQ